MKKKKERKRNKKIGRNKKVTEHIMITYDARTNTVRTTMGIILMRNLRSGVVCSVRGNDKLGVRWVIGGYRTNA